MGGTDDYLWPGNEAAEDALLGACLIHRDALDTALDVLKPEHFAGGSRRRLFRALTALHETDQPIDVVTVGSRMRELGELIALGDGVVRGMAWLTEIMNAAPAVDAVSVRSYALIVRDMSVRRDIIMVARRVTAECQGGRVLGGDAIEDSSDYAAGVSSEFAALAEHRAADTLVSLKDATRAAYEAMKASAERGQPAGVPSGYGAFDRSMGGLHAEDLLVVAGRPGMGKSAFAFGIGFNVAGSGSGFLGFSLEMSKEQIALRAVCSKSGVSMAKVRSGQLDGREWGAVTQAGADNSKLPFWIDSSPDISVPEMRAQIRRVKRECVKLGIELKVVAVDYVQLVAAPGVESREQQISKITRQLKALAKGERVTVIALSQLNRSVESRADKRPMLSDLRESGAIEQDADAVIFVYRDDYYNADSTRRGVAELIIQKHRNGPTGTAYVAWEGRTLTFRDLTESEREAARLDETGRGRRQ